MRAVMIRVQTGGVQTPSVCIHTMIQDTKRIVFHVGMDARNPGTGLGKDLGTNPAGCGGCYTVVTAATMWL